ncbi:MAG: hypothetical protein AAF492_20655 [Verrucomicrobiota bacterium]
MLPVLIPFSTSGALNFSVQNSPLAWDLIGANEPLHGDALLMPTVPSFPGFPNLGPMNHYATGTGAGGIDVDAFSSGWHFGNSTFLFQFLFAVTPDTLGLPGTDVREEATPNFGRLGEFPPVLPGSPTNDWGQAQDVFYSSPFFNPVPEVNRVHYDDDGFRDGMITPRGSTMGALGLLNLSAGNNAIDGIDLPTGGLFPDLIYYSLSSITVTGGLSGADVLVSPRGDGYTAVGSMYASTAQLGLLPADEITSLQILDVDGDPNTYNPAGGDEVFFSLALGSPTLPTIPVIRPATANQSGPADVLSHSSAGLENRIQAETLGLDALGNDALSGIWIEFDPLPEPGSFALMLMGLWVIRLKTRR